MKGYLLIGTTVLTGLSSGLFYAWAVSVIPGTRRISDLAYLETMQSINRAIINPWFMVIFPGPLLTLGLTIYNQFRSGDMGGFGLMLIAGIIYLIGTVGVTAFGNVPLNEALDRVQTLNIDQETVHSIRVQYEKQWNRLHLIRTVFSVLSFLVCVIATYNTSKTFQSIMNF